MICTRRQFFLGRWTKETADTDITPDAGGEPTPTAEPISELPTDFSPAMLKMQAQIMGLDLGSMSWEEAEQIVLAAFRSQRNPDRTEGKGV